MLSDKLRRRSLVSKKRDSLVDGAMKAMRIAVRKAIEDQERLGLAVPIWRDGSVVFLKSAGNLLVRESQAHYGAKQRGTRVV
jgi:hypothetical protein